MPKAPALRYADRMWVTCLLAALPLLGVVLLVVGIRGRRIDDHPTCSKCGFDLIGLGQSAACPECGSPLDRKGAIRQGQRAARRGLVIAGLMSLLVSAGIIAALL